MYADIRVHHCQCIPVRHLSTQTLLPVRVQRLQTPPHPPHPHLPAIPADPGHQHHPHRGQQQRRLHQPNRGIRNRHPNRPILPHQQNIPITNQMPKSTQIHLNRSYCCRDCHLHRVDVRAA